MAGGGGGAPQPSDMAEEQYVKAKTSVWWDIENCEVPRGCDPHTIAKSISSALQKLYYSGPVSISAYGDIKQITPSLQQALNSTGIALNHVPPGKDASDKKILVDMLIWAVDNPAPANCLMISGDRDFSNALHQLGLRRYNILLAQPLRASAPLVAAARTVWLWSSLAVGGLPLTKDECAKLTSTNVPHVVHSDSHFDSAAVSQPMDYFQENSNVGNRNFLNLGNMTHAQHKGKQDHSFLQASVPRFPADNLGYRPAYGNQSQFHRSPDSYGMQDQKVANGGLGSHYVPNNSNSSLRNDSQTQGSQLNTFAHLLRPTIGSVVPPLPPVSSSFNSHQGVPLTRKSDIQNPPSGPPTYRSDVGSLNISGQPRTVNYYPNSKHRNGLEGKESSTGPTNSVGVSSHQTAHNVQKRSSFNHGPPTRYPQNHQYVAKPSPSTSENANTISDSVSNVQGLIGIILLALNSLKNEKIAPTEENIRDCIRFGDTKHRNTDVKTALGCALEQQLVVPQQVGSMQIYVGKNEKVWKCLNPLAVGSNIYPKSTWDGIEKYLSSPDGRSAILATECRYEAATILKRMCLKEFSLGEILQILQMIIAKKRWIICSSHPGWQPIKIILAELNPDMGLAAATQT